MSCNFFSGGRSSSSSRMHYAMFWVVGEVPVQFEFERGTERVYTSEAEGVQFFLNFALTSPLVISAQNPISPSCGGQCSLLGVPSRSHGMLGCTLGKSQNAGPFLVTLDVGGPYCKDNN